MAFLNVTTRILAFSDQIINSNPSLKNVDWTRDQQGIIVTNPLGTQYTIDPAASLQIFNTLRSTTVGANTTFSVALSLLDQSIYRFTVTGGQAMGTRTDRNLTLSGIAVTVTLNINATATLTVPPAAPFDFTGVVAGDIIFIPGPITGDAATPFSTLNQGFWQVLSVVTTKNLVVTRLTGQTFSAASETQTLTANSQLDAFSAAGVQIGDTVLISAGFSQNTRRAFVIKTVTPNFFEVTSATPLAQESGIQPGTAGIVFYGQGKTYIYVETDQECAVQSNGATDLTQRISPILPADVNNVGFYSKRGPMYSLTLVNLTNVPLNALVITAQ